MDVTLNEIAKRLGKAEKVLILSHKNPDGDTLGSATGLYYALKQQGKRAEIICSDEFPKKFAYLFREYQADQFEPDLVVSVDIADTQLLGAKLECYADRIDICIDHHKSNCMLAGCSFVDASAAATCQIIYELLLEMGTRITTQMADCLYTGICTDTGCFKFSNTTSRTHRVAAELVDLGCHYEIMNRELFDTKSLGRILVEREVLENMEFFFGNRVSMIVVPQKLIQESRIDPSELDGVSAIPRQIEGVEIGVTLRERLEGGYKISLRTCQYADASDICAKLGGGGHARAAGCALDGSLEEVKEKLLGVIRPVLNQSAG